MSVLPVLLLLLGPALGARTKTSTSLALRASAHFRDEVRRMKREKRESEAALEKSLNLQSAYEIFERKHKARKREISLIKQAVHAGLGVRNTSSTSVHQSLLQVNYNPSASVQSARDMLGTLLTEAAMEYDQQHLECSVFFKKQCSVMETCREDISTANSLAAEWRAKVLGAQREINVCEIHIPRLEQDLKTSIQECNTRLGYLKRDLAVVMNDVAVMQQVLELTQCSGSSLLQTHGVPLCQCKAGDTASFAAVGHKRVHRSLASLKSRHVQRLVQEGLEQVAKNSEQEGQGEAELQDPTATQGTPTAFRNEPLPQQALPDDPCNGIEYDSGEGRGGCTLSGTPACFSLQNKFLSIQGETEDKRDDLVDEISQLTASCEKTKQTLEGEIEMFTTKLTGEQTKLAEATSGENSAMEEGQMKVQEHVQLKDKMMDIRSSCSSKLRNLESEMCALRKIRGELFKIKGDTHPFFQDCEVADWQAMECSRSCGGGEQELRRQVVLPPRGGGARCPPLTRRQRCNDQPCPIDCQVSSWSGFSACSAECGGGVRERARSVKVQPRYEGEPCGDLEETEACNMQACDRDCELSEWSPWSTCSKACNSGTQSRRKRVATPAVGRGRCPSEDDDARVELLPCNPQPCARDPTVPMVCRSKIDLVLLLDGSGSIGSSGWSATKSFAKKIVSGFSGPNADAQVAIILFSGPSTYSGLRRCTGNQASSLDMATDCKISVVQHFSNDLTGTTSNIDSLSWPRGTTLTSVALELARAELSLGRPDATPVVLTITDGIPMSSRRTSTAAWRLRRSARLLFGAVRLSNSGLRKMIRWATRPSSQNVLRISSFNSLESIETIDTIIEDICPSVEMPQLTTR